MLNFIWLALVVAAVMIGGGNQDRFLFQSAEHSTHSDG
jgi:hypothetical protein